MGATIYYFHKLSL